MQRENRVLSKLAIASGNMISLIKKMIRKMGREDLQRAKHTEIMALSAPNLAMSAQKSSNAKGQ